MLSHPRLLPALVAPLALTAVLTGATVASAEPLGIVAPVADEPPVDYTIAERVRLEPKPAPWVLPVADYRITGTFGAVSGLWSSSHTGLDFATAEGSPIAAITGGVVTSTGYDGAYGYKTVVETEDGSEVWYCHQSSVAVAVGQSVAPGDLIGYVGSTGNVTGPHLHLEVRDAAGTPLDPYAVLQEHGLVA